ncbi:MAG: FAD:protein FMN transferase [Candidatus Omnitrophica bacterium]|nr:FAD:protein FMN transferase [Candidatus Omnitrophota bacterium]
MSRRKKEKTNRKVIFLLLVSFALPGCGSARHDQKYSETKMLMGTIVKIDVCLDQARLSEIKDAYVGVWKRLEDISSRMSFFNEHGDVARINQSGLNPVSVGEDTYDVLKESKGFSRLTDGAFDVTVGPLVELWKESERNNSLPSQEEISETLSAVGPDNVQLLAEQHVRLLNLKTRIDLGGIAAGYAVDEAARLFRRQGITRFFIDVGGDIYVGGKNCSGEPWCIGIRDPRDVSKIIDIVQVTDKSVTTSGDYEKFYVIGGHQWSHIINPVTGYPQEDVTSATVIADRAVATDALATALCVLGGEEGTKRIDALSGQYASLIIVKQESGDIRKWESEEYKKYKYKK